MLEYVASLFAAGMISAYVAALILILAVGPVLLLLPIYLISRLLKKKR